LISVGHLAQVIPGTGSGSVAYW